MPTTTSAEASESIGNGGNAPTNVTLAEISKLLQDQLKTFIIDNLGKIIAAEVAKVKNRGGVADRAATREEELEEPLVLPTLPPQMAMHNDPNRPMRSRFDPNILPKYIHYKTNLQEWFTELQMEINLFGEELVCAAIPRYCFTEHSVTRAWYSGLDGLTQAFITKDRDCWARFKIVMTRQWALPIGLAVKSAEERKKKGDETFLEFFYVKMNLLCNAYPNCGSEGYIEMFKASLDDPAVELWARETHDIARFAAELCLYDDHLARYPRKAYIPMAATVTNTHFSYSLYDSYVQVAKSGVEKSIMESDVKTTEDPHWTNNEIIKTAENPRRINDEIIAFNKKRVESIQKRRDDSGKMVDSFVKENGSIGFLKNPCTLCAKSGCPNEWHFSFACPLNKLSGVGVKPRVLKAETLASYFFQASESENDKGSGGGSELSGASDPLPYSREAPPMTLKYGQGAKKVRKRSKESIQNYTYFNGNSRQSARYFVKWPVLYISKTTHPFGIRHGNSFRHTLIT